MGILTSHVFKITVLKDNMCPSCNEEVRSSKNLLMYRDPTLHKLVQDILLDGAAKTVDHYDLSIQILSLSPPYKHIGWLNLFYD